SASDTSDRVWRTRATAKATPRRASTSMPAAAPFGYELSGGLRSPRRTVAIGVHELGGAPDQQERTCAAASYRARSNAGGEADDAGGHCDRANQYTEVRDRAVAEDRRQGEEVDADHGTDPHRNHGHLPDRAEDRGADPGDAELDADDDAVATGTRGI